jgi:hypothetical protein
MSETEYCRRPAIANGMPKLPSMAVLKFSLRDMDECCPNGDSAGKFYRFCSIKKAAI